METETHTKNPNDQRIVVGIIGIIAAEIVCLASGAVIAKGLNNKKSELQSNYTAVEELKASAKESIPNTGVIASEIEEQLSNAVDIDGSSEFILEYYEQSGNSEVINIDVSDILSFASTGDKEIAANKAEYQKKLEEERKRKAEELAKQKSAAIAAEMQRRGSVGRLVCPTVGIDVALFASSAQSVVDASDSAAYFGFGSAMVVADHWNQGFTRIKSLSVGDQVYIDRGTSKTYYTVTGKSTGTNTGYDLIDGSGRSVSSIGGLVLYTCNGADWHNVTIVTLG